MAIRGPPGLKKRGALVQCTFGHSYLELFIRHAGHCGVDLAKHRPRHPAVHLDCLGGQRIGLGVAEELLESATCRRTQGESHTTLRLDHESAPY